MVMSVPSCRPQAARGAVGDRSGGREPVGVALAGADVGERAERVRLTVRDAAELRLPGRRGARDTAGGPDRSGQGVPSLLRGSLGTGRLRGQRLLALRLLGLRRLARL